MSELAHTNAAAIWGSLAWRDGHSSTPQPIQEMLRVSAAKEPQLAHTNAAAIWGSLAWRDGHSSTASDPRTANRTASLRYLDTMAKERAWVATYRKELHARVKASEARQHERKARWELRVERELKESLKKNDAKNELNKRIKELENQYRSAIERNEYYEAEATLNSLNRFKSQLPGNEPNFIINEEGLCKPWD